MFWRGWPPSLTTAAINSTVPPFGPTCGIRAQRHRVYCGGPDGISTRFDSVSPPDAEPEIARMRATPELLAAKKVVTAAPFRVWDSTGSRTPSVCGEPDRRPVLHRRACLLGDDGRYLSRAGGRQLARACGDGNGGLSRREQRRFVAARYQRVASSSAYEANRESGVVIIVTNPRTSCRPVPAPQIHSSHRIRPAAPPGWPDRSPTS